MKLKTLLSFSLALSMSAPALAAETISFKAWALAEVYARDLSSAKEYTFKPQITGSTDKGDLTGYVNVSLPEGIYLIWGQQHMPAELGTVCQVTDRVLVVKPQGEANDLKSAAFGYATHATKEGRLAQKCWEDFDAIGTVPDFRHSK